mgnify:CR=1 FL=1
MKKFTKGMLIAAGIFGAVGIGLTAAGGVMGASMSELTGVKSLKRVLLVADGDYDYDDSDDYDDDDDYDDYDYVTAMTMTAMIMTTATTVTTVRIMPALLMRMRKIALYIS